MSESQEHIVEQQGPAMGPSPVAEPEPPVRKEPEPEAPKSEARAAMEVGAEELGDKVKEEVIDQGVARLDEAVVAHNEAAEPETLDTTPEVEPEEASMDPVREEAKKIAAEGSDYTGVTQSAAGGMGFDQGAMGQFAQGGAPGVNADREIKQSASGQIANMVAGSLGGVMGAIRGGGKSAPSAQSVTAGLMQSSAAIDQAVKTNDTRGLGDAIALQKDSLEGASQLNMGKLSEQERLGLKDAMKASTKAVGKLADKAETDPAFKVFMEAIQNIMKALTGMIKKIVGKEGPGNEHAETASNPSLGR